MAEETPKKPDLRVAGKEAYDPRMFDPGLEGQVFRRALKDPDSFSSRRILGEDYEKDLKKAQPSLADLEGTSLLPPTIANDLRENDLEDLIPTLRQQIHNASSGQPGEWSEENKLRTLINQAYEQPKFKKRLEEGLVGGNLGEGAEERVKAVLEIVNSAHETGGFEQLPPGALGRAVQAKRVENHRMGPEGKARVVLTSHPETRAFVIDAQKTHEGLRGRYYNEWIAKNVNGTPSPVQIREANKYAAAQTAKEMSQTAARFTQVPFLDVRNPEMVKKIAQKDSIVPLGVRAHLQGRTTTDLFAPTLDELKREGGIWGFWRKVSPFEYMAPQVKLAREHLEKEHPRLAPWLLFGPAGGLNPVSATILLGSPIGLGERALESAGYTREEIVQEYLDGVNWWDEASENLALLTKESFLLQGHSEEEAEIERQRAKRSVSNKAAAFLTYFGDPDGITVGLLGAGRAAKLGISHYYRRELTRGLVAAKRAAAEAETPAEAIKLIEDINPSLAHILDIHISANTAEDITRLGDTGTKLGEAEARLQQVQQRLTAAGEDVSEDLSRFIRDFVYSGQNVDPSPEMLRIINDMRANPKAAGYRGMLDELGRSYDESLEVAALNLQRGEEAAKEQIRISKDLKDLREAVRVRDALATQLEETIGPEVFHGLAWGKGSEGTSTAIKQFWFAERRTRQLEILLDRLNQIEDMTSLPPEVKERIFIAAMRQSAKGRFVTESPTLDDLGVKQLFELSKNMRIPNRSRLIKTADGREELKQLLREGRIFGAADWGKWRRLLQDRLNTLQTQRKAQIKSLKKTLGEEDYQKLISRRKSFLDLQKKYLIARRAAPQGSERSLLTHQNSLENLRRVSAESAARSDSAIQQAVRSYSLQRIMNPKSRLKLPSGPRGKKVRQAAVTSKVFQLGQDSPDLFRLSKDEAAVIDRKLNGVLREQRAFSKAESGLEKAQREERWRSVLSDVVERITAAKEKLSDQKIWETAVGKVRTSVDSKEIQKILKTFTGTVGGGRAAVFRYEKGGKSIVQAFEEVGITPRALQEALEESGEAGLAIQRAIDTQGIVQLTPKLLEDIKNTFSKVLEARRIVQDKSQIQALVAIRSQANLPLNRRSFAGKLIRMAISPFAATIRFMGTPGEQALVQKVGTTTEETGQLIRANDQLMSQTINELERLTRLENARNDPGKFLDVLSTYFNGGNPIPLSRRGVPEFTVANVGEPLFQRAKRRVTSWHAKLSDKELAKAAEEASRYTVKTADENASYDPVVIAFSRIWLGKDVPAAGSSQAAKLYEDAVKLLSDPNINTFEDAVEAMKGRTLSILGPEAALDYGRLGRVYGFAANAIALGAVQDQLIPLARATTAGLITPDQMADVNRAIGGSSIGLKKIKNPDEVFDTLWRIGNPVLESRVAQTLNLKESADRSKRLVKLATDPQGKDIFVVGALRTELMSSLNGKIKELETFSNQQPGIFAKTWEALTRDILPWWKQSATMGWLIPNAGYITYVRFGDMSQLFLSSGVRFTLRSQLQNVWSDFPLFGRAFQNHLAEQTARSKSPQLRGLLETSFSPHFADFFSGKQGFWRLKNGELVSWEGLRKRAVSEGITDVFPSAELEDGLRQAGLSSLSGMKGFRRALDNDWSNGIKTFSTQTQIRQRVGTWLLHISDGKTIDEASKLVRDSLYDWSHGVSRLEQQTIAQFMPFWRYWRLAMGQTYEGMLRPFMNPTKDGFAKAMYGNTRMARLRELIRLQMDTDEVLSDPRSIDEIAHEDGYTNAFARVMTPEWLPRQLQLYNRRNSMERQDLLARLQAPGRQMLNTAGVGAPSHGIDQLEGVFLPWIGMLGVGLKAAGEDAASEHFMNMAKTGFMDKLSPHTRDILEKGYSDPGSTLKSVRPVEAWVLENMTHARVEYDPETGKHFASKGMANTIRLLPVMGTEITRFLDAVHFKNPNNEKLSREAVKRIFLEYTRIVREYSYDPYLQFDLRMRSALTRLKEDDKRAGYLIEKPE
jgi:hypothetical protein